jgi:hypothetical protein
VLSFISLTTWRVTGISLSNTVSSRVSSPVVSYTPFSFLSINKNPVNRYFTTQQVNRTPSTITGRVWNDKYPFTNQPYSYDADGADNLNGVSGGYNRDFDNDIGHGGVNLRLEKCEDGFEDPTPKATWNINPPRTTTAADGTYTFSGIIPGIYAVIRESTIPDESIVSIERANSCQFSYNSNVINFVYFHNFFTFPYANYIQRFTPGSTVTLDHRATYQGQINYSLYTDYNHDNVQNSWENDCLNYTCTQYITSTVRLKDSNGDILLDNVNTSPGGIPFYTLVPGQYTVEVISNSSAYPPLSVNELTKQTTIATSETDSFTFGFNPTNESTINGRVFIDRGSGAYTVNGDDGNPATTFDNDIALSGYTVELYYGYSFNQLAATVVTDSNGLYQFSNIAEGFHSVRVVNPAPSGTTCASCARADYIYRNTIVNYDLTYNFNGRFLLMSYFDSLQNGTRETQEIDSPNVRFKVTYSDGYVVASNLSPSSYLYQQSQLNNLIPGDYTVEVITSPTTLSTIGGYTSPATYSLLPSEYLAKDYPFQPGNNSVSGKVFVDRGGLNNTFEAGGADGNAGLTFDNEVVVPNATVTIHGPNGAVQTLTDASGNYTFTNLPSGRYQLDKQNRPTGDLQFWDVTPSGSQAGSILDECATYISCRRFNNIYYPYIELDISENITNDYTFIYTNTIATQYIDDKNGDGLITYYANTGYTETGLSGTSFELLTYTNEVLPCQITSFPGNPAQFCVWTALPPGAYTVRKLADLANKVNTNTARSTNSSVTSNVINYGNVANQGVNVLSGSINQYYFINYFQFLPPSTNNASIIGKVFTDRDSDLLYENNGQDGNPITIEDNDLTIPNVNIQLTGTSNLGQPITRSTITGSDGRYQVTDLPAGTYQIQAGTP